MKYSKPGFPVLHYLPLLLLLLNRFNWSDCPTLRDPMDCGLPGSSIHGTLQKRVLDWVAIAFSTISWSLLKLISIGSVMPSNHLILCCPLLLPPIFSSIRVFSNESALLIRWPKYWGFSFNISPSNKYSGLISFTIDWSDLLAVQGLPRVFSSTTVLKHQFFSTQPSLWFNSHICTWLLEKP